MKAVRLMLPVALAFSVAAAGLVQAQAQNAPADKPAPGMHQKGDWQAKHKQMKEHFEQELGLTPDQKAKIEAIRKNYFETHKGEIEAKKAKFAELKRMKESGASPEEMKAKREALHKEFAAGSADRKAMQEQIKAVLTPEQQAKMEAMKQQHKMKRGQHKKPQAKPAS